MQVKKNNDKSTMYKATSRSHMLLKTRQLSRFLFNKIVFQRLQIRCDLWGILLIGKDIEESFVLWLWINHFRFKYGNYTHYYCTWVSVFPVVFSWWLRHTISFYVYLHFIQICSDEKLHIYNMNAWINFNWCIFLRPHFVLNGSSLVIFEFNKL